MVHRRGIIHRGVQRQSVLLKGDKVRIFDWANAARPTALATDAAAAEAAGVTGDPYHMAPEALALAARLSATGGALSAEEVRAVTTPQLDSWGVGSIAFFLLTGSDPLGPRPPALGAGAGAAARGTSVGATGILDAAQTALVALVQRAGMAPSLSLPSGCCVSPRAAAFVEACLTLDQRLRPSCEQLLDHPWLAQPCCSSASAHGGGGAGSPPPTPRSLSIVRPEAKAVPRTLSPDASQRVRRDQAAAKPMRALVADGVAVAAYVVLPGSPTTSSTASSPTIKAGLCRSASARSSSSTDSSYPASSSSPISAQGSYSNPLLEGGGGAGANTCSRRGRHGAPATGKRSAMQRLLSAFCFV